MKFHGKAGQETRTWILFFVGISLVALFAWQRNPLNPWWTLIIGAFTCTAIIVSAVQSVLGGMNDIARKTFKDNEGREERRDDDPNYPEEADEASFSIDLGGGSAWPLRVLRRRYAVAI